MLTTPACASRDPSGDESTTSDGTSGSTEGTGDGGDLGDLPFLEEFCGQFTNTNDCRAANLQNPKGNWSCQNPATGRTENCACHWREFIEVAEEVPCDGTRVVEGCVPGFYDGAGEILCKYMQTVGEQCEEIMIGQDDSDDPAWVSIGWSICRTADTPDGDSTAPCTIDGSETPSCNDCTIQLVNELCE